MIDHVTFKVQDIAATKAFYEKALKPLGYTLSFDQVFDGVSVIGFGKDGKIDTWFTTDTLASGPAHLCLRAETQGEVDAFYAEAIAAGGKDNGAPGVRTEYHDKYYAAFVFDPNGNNIEVVFGN